MSLFFGSLVLIALLGIGLSAINYKSVMKVSEGTKVMQSIAKKIRDGASVFLKQEYKVLIIVVLILLAGFGIIIFPRSGIAFAIGALMSGLTGWYGMRMSTRANVRVTNTARDTQNLGEALKVAFRGGSVMGLATHSLALLGFAIVMLMNKSLWAETATWVSWTGIEFKPLPSVLTAYGLGCSIIALFNRVGGGIYTKAADMGSDLVGKAKLGLDEDSPRNPGVIADCVGDNVGDTAGLGSDLLESFVGSLVSAVILAIYLFATVAGLNLETLYKLIMYPVAVATVGLVACLISNIYMNVKNFGDDPHKELNTATWLSAGLTAIGAVVLAVVLFRNQSFGDLTFNFGMFSPAVSVITGIITGIAIGMVAEYYTSYSEKGRPRPTNKIVDVSQDGAALNITAGLSVGFESCLSSCVLLAAGLLVASFSSGVYGTALAAVGMLSFVGMTVSVDSYGPISDNAGGIAEMAQLEPEVRAITDKLDAVGNTTAAIGKGFAIGSATYATTSLMFSYLYSYNITDSISLNAIDSLVLAGILLGLGLVWLFSGLLIGAVTKAAKNMVEEIERQFNDDPALLAGEAEPDYNKCIAISTNGALAEMRKPTLIAILVPLGCGMVFGPEFVGGLLFGSTVSAVVLAIFCGNAGGAWDNAKKAIELSGGKGTPAHVASVIGDTVGDPLKDTVGPSLDIFIKFMSTLSILGAPFFMRYNILDLLSSFFK